MTWSSGSRPVSDRDPRVAARRKRPQLSKIARRNAPGAAEADVVRHIKMPAKGSRAAGVRGKLQLWTSGRRPSSGKTDRLGLLVLPEDAGSDGEARPARSKGIRSISTGTLGSGWVQRNVKRDPGFALLYYKKESRYVERKHGMDSPQALRIRTQYAICLHRTGQNEKAEAELAAVIARRGPARDVGDESTRTAMNWHAHVLNALGRYGEAEHEWRDLAAECDRLLGADHPDAIDAHENHAYTLARVDRVEEAEAEMAGVVEKKTAALGSDDEATLRSRTNRAVYLSTLGRLAESEAAWRGLADAKGRALGADHPDTIDARERLAMTLYDLRRLPEAAGEYGEVAALRAATVGTDHPDARQARDWHARIQKELRRPDQTSSTV